MKLIEISSACARICERQLDVDLFGLSRMICAYDKAMSLYRSHPIFDENIILKLHQELEPFVGGYYRQVPVVFDNGDIGCSPNLIPSVMTNMIDCLDMGTDPDEFIKAFLKCHPFIDGNGRMAFILYNWLKRTLAHPLDLPYYFGDK